MRAEPFQRTRKGKYGFYNPQIPYINTLRTMMAPYKPDKPIDSAVAVTYTFSFAPPESWSKKKKEKAIAGHHVSRPDASNLHYPIENAIKDFLIADDALIVEYYVRKQYAEKDSIELTITVL